MVMKNQLFLTKFLLYSLGLNLGHQNKSKVYIRGYKLTRIVLLTPQSMFKLSKNALTPVVIKRNANLFRKFLQMGFIFAAFFNHV